MNRLKGDRIKGTFGWPVRLLLLLLILAFIGLAGPARWRMLFNPRSLILIAVTVVFFLGWNFFDSARGAEIQTDPLPESGYGLTAGGASDT
jgi:hypothetical protein